MTQALASTMPRRPQPTSFAQIWARKYVINVANQGAVIAPAASQSLSEVTSRQGRAETAERLKRHLRLASAQAWSDTERLLSYEVQRHQIDASLLNPVEIAADSRALFEQALEAYAHRLTPHRMSVAMSAACGQMRQKHTTQDPRAIGFVSMQFHYTGMKLLSHLSPLEQALFEPYLKVMDDHMYMPLRAAYEAAAKHPIDSPELRAVQHLLPLITPIAKAICDRVTRLHPHHQTLSGALNSRTIRTSSIRDAEMFQVYLCLCVLQGDIHSVQEELFPLCLMLYPALKVDWFLVQKMLRFLGEELLNRLSPDDMATLFPDLRSLTEMFADEVFQTA